MANDIRDPNWRVQNAALSNAALVPSSKNWKNIRDGGQRRKKYLQNALGPGPAFCQCRRAGIDAALVKVLFLFAGAPPIESKLEQRNQTLRWRLAKVASDTVQHFGE